MSKMTTARICLSDTSRFLSQRAAARWRWRKPMQSLPNAAARFPLLNFELKIIKTTGDKLQKASMAKEGGKFAKRSFHQGTRSRSAEP